MAADIVIKGAREHNLRDIHLTLPRNQLICLTGVSGSGKSSLAFDTLYAEGQRRYVESLSSFARQFVGQMPKPDVDYIGGLSPSISISQKTSGQNPRSTVGTITEIYDYLRLLYARTGQGHCPKCARPITAQTREQIIERIAQLPAGTPLVVLAPLIRAERRIPRPVRRSDEARLRKGTGRWAGRGAHRSIASRSADAARHRSGGRSPGGGSVARAAGRSGRTGAQARSRQLDRVDRRRQRTWLGRATGAGRRARASQASAGKKKKGADEPTEERPETSARIAQRIPIFSFRPIMPARTAG